MQIPAENCVRESVTKNTAIIGGDADLFILMSYNFPSRTRSFYDSHEIAYYKNQSRK